MLVDTQEHPAAAQGYVQPVVVFVGTDGSTYVEGVPVTRESLAGRLPFAPVDEVVEALRAMGADL